LSQSDQNINEIFKIFAEAVGTVLKDVCENSIPTVVLEPKIDLASKFIITAQVTKRVYPSERLFRELKELNEIKKYLEFMLSGGEFSKRLDDIIKHFKWISTNDPFYKSHIFLEFLKTIVDEYKEKFSCSLSEQNFKVIFNEVMEYIYAEDRELVVIVPLVNLELKGADETAIDKYRIRKLSEWETRKLIDDPFVMTGLNFNKINVLDSWWLEITTKDLKADPLVLLPNIDDLIKVVRLFKKGYVSRVNILISYLKAPKIFSSMINPLIVIIPNYTIPIPRVNTRYSLDINEVNGLRQLWKLYNCIKDNLPKELMRALKWFNKSYGESSIEDEKSEIEDRILDLAVAFETMFRGNHYEYLAPILLLDKRDKRITGDLKKLRNERNKIVHSGHSELQIDELKEIVINAEEIFRRSFRRFLELIYENKRYEETLNDIINKNRILPRY